MRRFGPLLVASVAALALAGCAVAPEPFTLAETRQRAEADLKALTSDQEPIAGPVTLYEAMARAVKYNLDHRLKVMEAAFAERQLTSANLDMLPELAARAGFEGRSNQSGSSSRSLLTGQQSLETSTSLDRERTTYDFGLSWNVLDFGLSYVRANQQADRALIVQERKRKVVQNIVQDVRAAFWQAVSAERLLQRIDPMIERVGAALAAARTIESQRLQPPRDALLYRRQLLEAMRQMKELRRDLVGGKAQLAALMGLPPGQPFTLAADALAYEEPRMAVTLDRLEEAALLYRPELREESYQTRIGAAEVKHAMLSMLPGLRLDTGHNFDSNSYSYNNHWWSYSARINANLLDTLLAGPARIRAAEAAEEVARTRRLALSMAVLSQAHISWLGYQQAVSEFRTARELNEVDQALLGQVRALARTGRGNDLDLIQAELNGVVGELRRDIAFAQMSNAAGRVYLTAGADPLPETVDSHDVKTLAKAIEATLGQWGEGRLSPSPSPAAKPVAVREPLPAYVDKPAPAADPAPAAGPAEPERVVLIPPPGVRIASLARWWEAAR